MQTQNDTELETLNRDLNKAVNRRKWSMIRQRTVPLVAAPIAVGTGLLAGLMGAWDYLPPLMQKYGTIAAAGAFSLAAVNSMAKPLFNKAASPFITKDIAAQEIDNDIGSTRSPTQTLRDHASKFNPDGADRIWELNLKQIWNKFSDKIKDQKFELGHAPYYTKSKSRAALHAAAITGFVAATSLTNVTVQDFRDALAYQPPPPALAYKAWVTPPNDVPQAPIYQDGMLRTAVEEQRNLSLSAHEGSVLSIVTYERQGEIMVNGVRLEPIVVEQDEDNNRNRSNIEEFTYNVPLDEGEIMISIEGTEFRFDVTPDEPPEVNIISAERDAENPGSVVLEYTIKDDFGATGADISIGIRGPNGERLTPLAPNVVIPPIAIPHTDRPDGP